MSSFENCSESPCIPSFVAREPSLALHQCWLHRTPSVSLLECRDTFAGPGWLPRRSACST